jgi:hypothetical protein
MSRARSRRASIVIVIFGELVVWCKVFGCVVLIGWTWWPRSVAVELYDWRPAQYCRLLARSSYSLLLYRQLYYKRWHYCRAQARIGPWIGSFRVCNGVRSERAWLDQDRWMTTARNKAHRQVACKPSESPASLVSVIAGPRPERK